LDIRILKYSFFSIAEFGLNLSVIGELFAAAIPLEIHFFRL